MHLEKHIKMDEPFMEAGLDSLGAVEIRNQLSNDLDISLPSTLSSSIILL